MLSFIFHICFRWSKLWNTDHNIFSPHSSAATSFCKPILKSLWWQHTILIKLLSPLFVEASCVCLSMPAQMTREPLSFFPQESYFLCNWFIWSFKPHAIGNIINANIPALPISSLTGPDFLRELFVCVYYAILPSNSYLLIPHLHNTLPFRFSKSSCQILSLSQQIMIASKLNASYFTI